MHRDLSLVHIYLSDQTDMPRVKIGDLGSAAKLPPGEKFVDAVGSVGFMAPETAMKLPNDFKSDIYSLGIILYFLICADLPIQIDCLEEEGKSFVAGSDLSFD